MRATALRNFPISSEDRVLDVGCGTGYATTALAKRAGTVIGLDQSEDQLHRARRNLETGIDLARGDAERLPFATNTFDAIWSSGSIEYWPAPTSTLEEFARVGRPGAPILLVGPNAPGTNPLQYLADATMLVYDHDQARQWCEAAGLVEIESTTLGPWYAPEVAIVTTARVPSS